MFTLKKDVSVEITEKKSVFYADAFFVRSEEESLEAIEKMRKKYSDATHHVYAYSLREQGIRRFSDAGEPSGTAGMPVLKVIDFNNLVDTCVIVTRYFGGILLGAGGLVRAYTKAAAEAVEKAGKAEIIEAVNFSLEYGYDLHNVILRILEKYGTTPQNQQFTDKVHVESSLQTDAFENVKTELENLYYTNVKIEMLQTFMTRQM
ncbi:MAG: YigZ family protein [Clostridiales bacterium]|nr:MAG: YigZ family protein [Clostridiales bacterium]